MVYDLEGWNRVGMLQVGCDDLIEAPVTVKMKIVRTSQEMQCEDQPHQTEIMIAVEMRNEDMIDPVHVCLIAHELHLRTFPAVDKEIPVLDLDQLG